LNHFEPSRSIRKNNIFFQFIQEVNGIVAAREARTVFIALAILLLLIGSEGCGGGGSNNSTSAPSAPLGTARVSWDPVTTYTDNTPMISVDYNIYYRKEPSNSFTPDKVIHLSNPGSNTNYYFTNLSSGTYYFAVSAIDPNSGVESELSEQKVKILP